MKSSERLKLIKFYHKLLPFDMQFSAPKMEPSHDQEYSTVWFISLS